MWRGNAVLSVPGSREPAKPVVEEETALHEDTASREGTAHLTLDSSQPGRAGAQLHSLLGLVALREGFGC